MNWCYAARVYGCFHTKTDSIPGFDIVRRRVHEMSDSELTVARVNPTELISLLPAEYHLRSDPITGAEVFAGTLLPSRLFNEINWSGKMLSGGDDSPSLAMDSLATSLEDGAWLFKT